MSRSPLAVALVAVLALAGCSSTPFGDAGRIHYVRVESGYSRSDFAYGAAGRDMTTEILGNPFPGVSQAVFDQAVTDAMQGAHFGQPTHFTTTPDDTARPVYRVRMLWNGPLSANGARLCESAPENAPYEGGGPDPDGQTRLVAAFCRSDRPATYLVGSIGGVTSTDDPRFVSFVRQVTTQLFPPRDGTFEPGDCNWQTC